MSREPKWIPGVGWSVDRTQKKTVVAQNEEEMKKYVLDGWTVKNYYITQQKWELEKETPNA